jgi:hypothetical protein
VHLALDANPGPDSTFEGWGGACSGTGACELTLDSDTAVSASFARQSPPPPVEKRRSTVKLHADDIRIQKGDRVELTARVLPCPERARDRIRLLKRGDPFARKRWNDHCRATFHTKLLHDARFRALVAENAGHLADRSRAVKVNVTHG